MSGPRRADWDRDPLFVRSWGAWALAEDVKPSALTSGRSRAKKYHVFLVGRHGRDYYRPEGRRDLVSWEDAVAYKEHLKGLVQGGKLSRDTALNCWYVATRFHLWRSKYDPKNERYFDDWKRLERFLPTGDFPDSESDEEKGSLPFDVEAGHFHKVIDAARAVEFPPGTREDRGEPEDYYMAMVAAHTGQRTQIIGLRWDDVSWESREVENHTIRVRTKGGKPKTFPLLAPLETALRELRAKHPERRRMVFRWTSYPWDDKVPAEGQCEHRAADGTRCPETEGLKLYYGRERDEVYCLKHFSRTLAAAHHANQDLATRAMKRTEEALHRLYPEVVEEVVDPKTGAATVEPVHVHWHRFRKTLGTWYEELGLPEAIVAKIVGWKSLKVLREKYHKPGRKRLYKAAAGLDLVEASRAAERGELDKVRVKSTDEMLRELLAAAEERAHRAEERADRADKKLDEVLAELRARNGNGHRETESAAP